MTNVFLFPLRSLCSSAKGGRYTKKPRVDESTRGGWIQLGRFSVNRSILFSWLRVQPLLTLRFARLPAGEPVGHQERLAGRRAADHHPLAEEPVVRLPGRLERHRSP